jgi:hypothetical protein
MSALNMIGKLLFRNSAPVHVAEKYRVAHDETLNLVEARRGRGKSYGAVKIAALWLLERWDDILSGVKAWIKVYSNIKFHLRRMAYVLLKMGVPGTLQEVWGVLKERVVYVNAWDQLLTAYDSLVLVDEANRNLNQMDMSKAAQQHMMVVHDWLQQTRKHALTLWFFVQDISWIKSAVLALTDRLWRAKRVRKKGTAQVRYFPWYGGDPFSKGKGAEISRRADFKMRFDFDLWTARCYDTRQAVSTLKQESQFGTFEEISDYMYARGLKPAATPERPDPMTLDEERSWFDAWVSAAPAAPPAPSGGGGSAGVGVPVVPLEQRWWVRQEPNAV